MLLMRCKKHCMTHKYYNITVSKLGQSIMSLLSKQLCDGLVVWAMASQTPLNFPNTFAKLNLKFTTVFTVKENFARKSPKQFQRSKVSRADMRPEPNSGTYIGWDNGLTLV